MMTLLPSSIPHAPDPAAGGSDDYVRGSVGVKYAYTVELPPHETSHYGFLLPESFVQSVVSDTWDGLKAFAFGLYNHLLTKNQEQELGRSNSPSKSELTFVPSKTDPDGPENSRLKKDGTDPRNDTPRPQVYPATEKGALQRLQDLPVAYLVQSLWTGRPLWFSPPRYPTYHHKETTGPDIINTLIRKTRP